MRKVIKRLLVPVLSMAVIMSVNSFLTPVQAVSSTDTSDLSAIETIAKNAPQFMLGSDKKQWSSVTVVNSRPLYDFSNKLIAYSLDLESNIDNEKAFVIVSTNEEDGPILEFATGTDSPYDKEKDNDQSNIYDGLGGYYSHNLSTGKYHDLTCNVDLDDTNVKNYKSYDENKQYVSKNPNLAKKNRLNLSQKSQTANSPSTSTASITPAATPSMITNILNVPDYRWYDGCTPTSAAMVLKYDFSTNSALAKIPTNNFIAQLGAAMKTSSTGNTYPPDAPSALVDVMKSYGVTISSTIDFGPTFQKAMNSINANQPFILDVVGSLETAPSYPTGFGTHSMAACGYTIVNGTTDYVIVHDTGVDGIVLCDYNSSALGTSSFIYVVY
ncbi:C39 family peptidase [Clostridium sp. WILCCON 0269]|uniref:C39 family peptidase n=1 Tax=Candidatus Clostridium eludens TaxID=3381663 RepID=A0ABW8SQ07_9CLOT